MRFVIVDGLPYLYAEGKAYKCRFDEAGFTPTQEEIELNDIPAEVFSELEIEAQCFDFQFRKYFGRDII